MGSPTNEAGRASDEIQHQVTLTNGFYLGKFEVTQAQYETVMTGNTEGLNAKPSKWSNNNDRPVEQVSWNDVQVFLSRLNDMEQTAGRLPAGWKYVLPTEAQWEYACRAGTTTAYSWGNDINSSRANYNWDGGSTDGSDFKQTRDVGQYAANPWGFFDMHGNVWEWVHDWKANYPGVAQTNPEGPALGSHRVYGVVPSKLKVGIYVQLNATTPRFGSFKPLGFRLAFQSMPADTANPELELFGGTAITREAGQAWAEPGVEAHDARDGNITDQIVVTGTVDMNSTGTYLLTYSVQDGGGNTATATRTVTVVGNRTVDLNATVAMDMIWCPPGTFTMGSPTTEAGRGTDETEHNVSLTRGFYLGKYEVTQAQYEAVMTGVTGLKSTPSDWHGNPDRPVEKVSWNDAQVFLTRLNEQQAGNLPAGWSYVLAHQSHNGNMPVVLERPRPLLMGCFNCQFERELLIGMVTIRATTSCKLAMSGNIRQICGAYLTCMEMCGSGPWTGTRRLIPPVTRLLIQQDRLRARYGSYGVVPGTTTGRTCTFY